MRAQTIAPFGAGLGEELARQGLHGRGFEAAVAGDVPGMGQDRRHQNACQRLRRRSRQAGITQGDVFQRHVEDRGAAAVDGHLDLRLGKPHHPGHGP